MKITKRQLRRIIKEEKQRLLKEFGAMDKEVLSPLVEFGQAWSGLGDSVQSQIIDVVNGYIEANEEMVYEINPNALKIATRRLSRSLNILGQSNPDAEEVMEALEWAQGIFDQGDAEVEADARAAGDL
tara:strand:- start:148 stop:531 length:384 start_codon:yes stop_codon:yes gene_type:complete